MKTIARTELYERLWTEPKRDVARSFGVTSDRLSRLCRRNDIPIPVQGFWNRGPVQLAVISEQLAVGSEEWAAAASEIAGQRVEPLPQPEQDWEITIEPSAGHVPDDTPHERGGIQIPEKLTRPHPLLRETRSFLRTARKDEHGRYVPGLGCLDILVGYGCRQRAYRIMDTILKECEARGWLVKIERSGRGGTVVDVAGGEVSIGIEEVVRRERRLTEEELAKGKSYGRTYGMQLYTRCTRGELALVLGVGSRKNRRAWREGARFSAEYLVNGFMRGLQEAGEWQKRTDEAYARAAAERREAERLERLIEEERRREAARFEALLADAHDWSRSRTVREYIEARVKAAKAKGQDTGAGSDIGRWAAWASAQADRIDPLVRRGPAPDAKPRPKSFYEIMSSIGQSRERRA